jgi:hypothetical protein
MTGGSDLAPVHDEDEEAVEEEACETSQSLVQQGRGNIYTEICSESICPKYLPQATSYQFCQIVETCMLYALFSCFFSLLAHTSFFSCYSDQR